MNSILGAKIKSLRESKGITQEQVAEKLGCTRQKYSRLEKGLVDISYASLAVISKALSVRIKDITSVVDNNFDPEPVYRDNGGSVDSEQFIFINDMIDTFFAHRKLYHSIKQVDEDE
ncbi:MAG: helix-turn-helix transcriptional regulator [Prolixibacteraceae bacterium]|nr:helix-turn-helix transcriptional regulator [Prolixibacteraceae bacterium]